MNSTLTIEEAKDELKRVKWAFAHHEYTQKAVDIAIEALEKQIEIDESIPVLRQCAEKAYCVQKQTNDSFWFDSFDYMRTRAWALYDVAINREKHIEDICMLDVMWETRKRGQESDEE